MRSTEVRVSPGINENLSLSNTTRASGKFETAPKLGSSPKTATGNHISNLIRDRITNSSIDYVPACSAFTSSFLQFSMKNVPNELITENGR
ncbi:hypothetical protein CEXT_94931 [Caerostris extrusa]|uniref:Uncharacterized protein n=1 Tax=Caerostris extrusa TaxID=172846 RepID=A0AAV4VPL2_CAEEX|nr:hypothetical protein CEXT_94931 [Caerostris extrusa]